jgi:hypothetical protein
MQRLPSLTLALALAATMLASGCGGGSSSSSGGSGAAASSTAATSPATSGGSGASTSSGSGTGSTSKSGSGNAISTLLVSTCKKRIQDEPALTTSAKSKLEPLCDRAADGPVAAREVARQVCREVVLRSAQPGSPMTPARKQALEACKSAK